MKIRSTSSIVNIGRNIGHPDAGFPLFLHGRTQTKKDLQYSWELLTQTLKKNIMNLTELNDSGQHTVKKKITVLLKKCFSVKVNEENWGGVSHVLAKQMNRFYCFISFPIFRFTSKRKEIKVIFISFCLQFLFLFSQVFTEFCRHDIRYVFVYFNIYQMLFRIHEYMFFKFFICLKGLFYQIKI